MDVVRPAADRRTALVLINVLVGLVAYMRRDVERSVFFMRSR
jgi:hypothetical protein